MAETTSKPQDSPENWYDYRPAMNVFAAIGRVINTLRTRHAYEQSFVDSTIDTERLNKDELSEVCDEPRHAAIEVAATNLLVAVWRGVQAGWIPDRSAVDDAALNLRDALNPDWPVNPDWLPEELQD